MHTNSNFKRRNKSPASLLLLLQKYHKLILVLIGLALLCLLFFAFKLNTNQFEEEQVILLEQNSFQHSVHRHDLADEVQSAVVGGGAQHHLAAAKVLGALSDPSHAKMISYFDLAGDASRVTWAHAVNSRAQLVDALASNVLFLEADIMLIETNDQQKEQQGPIMAHPPNNSSDLSFSQWFAMTNPSRKGLKLDFKTANAVEPCLKLLQSEQNKIKSPVVLNADVFQGAEAPLSQIDPVVFVNQSRQLFPTGVLSLGWTTTSSVTANYTWSDMYAAYILLKNRNLLNDAHAEVTFAVRALWSTKSLFRLLWLQIFTKSSLTVWSHATDRLTSLDSLLLFRHYFDRSVVYYDLPGGEQRAHFEAHAFESAQSSTKSSHSGDGGDVGGDGGADGVHARLAAATDPLVRYYLSDRNHFWSDSWTSLHGTILQCDYAALMVNNGATFVSRRQYRATTDVGAYTVSGKFELFSIINKSRWSSSSSHSKAVVKSRTSPYPSASSKNRDNHATVDDKLVESSALLSESGSSGDGEIACARISLRTSAVLSIYDELTGYVRSHTPGSVHVYLFTSGLVRVYAADRLVQEANLQPSDRFEYDITDAGETSDVRVDLSSYGAADNVRYSVQLLVKSAYVPPDIEQQFYVTQSLLTDNYALGVDVFKIAADPQDRKSSSQGVGNN